MLFNSYIFWAFFGVVFLLYVKAPHRWQNVLLLIASYVFYGSWNWKFLSLILISTFIDFFSSIWIERSRFPWKRKALLALSVCTNLGLLGVFKYYNFFISEFIDLLNFMGFNSSAPALNVILPVGISFYTFQTMSYTIDVYFGKVKPVTNLLDFALFVCFFPQLVAGPIERFNRLMPQIQRPRKLDGDCFVEGLYHVSMGLFKKIVIADNMATLTNAIFATEVSQLTGPECLMGVLAFAFQIYGDFSGYSSIAQGVAKWLGFELMYNFKMPYFAASPSEFWQRWHISLSTWLRDYLYIPLGGNRQGPGMTYRNLMLTMLLGGLWHGAGWTFIAWGGYHGLILCVYRLFGRPRRDNTEAPVTVTAIALKALAIVWMFGLTLIGWLFFRAESLDQVAGMLSRIVTDPTLTDRAAYIAGMILFLTGPLMVYEFIIYLKKDDMLWLTRQRWPARAAMYLYLWSMILFMAPEGVHEFIYFQF